MIEDPLATAAWRKSSRSATQGECVEIAQTLVVTGIRDSKNPTGIRLRLTPAQWSRFLDHVKNGDHTREPIRVIRLDMSKRIDLDARAV